VRSSSFSAVRWRREPLVRDEDAPACQTPVAHGALEGLGANNLSARPFDHLMPAQVKWKPIPKYGEDHEYANGKDPSEERRVRGL
jgi:hypothetical protein